DLSISRSSFDWGIKVPWDESHVVYVWFDALLNYVTAVGWGSDNETFRRRWPAVHIVGKDIARFHAVIWPAMLMAAGLPVPARVFGHGWLLVGGEKMSKSKLTGIAPAQITDVFGSDAFRYYFLSAITFGQDGSFSWEDLSARYQAELANGFGNLGSRVVAMVQKYRDGVVPSAPLDPAITELEKSVTDAAHAAIGKLAIHDAISSIATLVDALNLYVTVNQPWVLAKDPAQAARLDTVLATLVHGVGTLAVLFSPVMPKATATLWAALGEGGSVSDVRVDRAWDRPGGGTVSTLEPLFPRIELEPNGA
ncbi:MAG: class I tRNA ligase family protein, partial [Pseudolysinimonas sp.]